MRATDNTEIAQGSPQTLRVTANARTSNTAAIAFQVQRATGFDPVSQARRSRAKTKCGADAGSAQSSAERPRTRERGREISGCDERALAGAEEARPARPTEDTAGRRFAAARAESGSTERTPPIRQSLFVNSTNLCGGKHKAKADIAAQNGRIDRIQPPVRAQCKAKKHAKKRKAKHGGRR